MNISKHSKQRSPYILLIVTIVEIALAYGAVSEGINEGNILWYVLGAALLIKGLKNIVRTIKAAVRGYAA